MVNLLWKKIPTLFFPVFQRREKLGKNTGNYVFLPSPSFAQKATTLHLGAGEAHMDVIFDVQILKHPTTNLSHQDFSSTRGFQLFRGQLEWEVP